MKYEFDPPKDAANVAKHGVSFRDFAGFDGEPASERDDRKVYGEDRYRAFGRIGGLGYCLVFVPTADGLRIISLRRAHEKEMRRYGR